MALNIGSSGSSFKPYIQYQVSTSSWKMSHPDGAKPFQFTQAIFDLANIKTGWNFIATGQAPEWVMDPSLEQPAPKPQDGREWKRGFKVTIFSKNIFGDLEPEREFSASQTGSSMAIANLYEKYEALAASNANMVPVVEYKGSEAAKVGKGNTTIPQFEIVKWVPRPSELGGASNNNAPQATVQQVAPQPVNTVSEF